MTMKSCICLTWEDVEIELETIPGDASIVIEELSSNFEYPVHYSVQWMPGTEVHKFRLSEDRKYDLYYKFEDGEFADIGTPALQRTETMVSHLE